MVSTYGALLVVYCALLGREKYPGTQVFVSHDCEFVSLLATRIIEMKPEGIVDFTGNYEDYLRSQGVA